MFIDERQPWGYRSQFRILRRRKKEPIRQRKKKNVNFNKLKGKEENFNENQERCPSEWAIS